MALAVMALVGVWAVVRSMFGVDFGDGSHAVELAMRMARGDVPFRDEMNMQVLGSWPAVPFAWVWLHTVGLDGIVLASRIFYVVVVAAVVGACWRAVAPHFGRGTTAVALVAAVIPTAYNQQVLSYNTTPGLMYLLATCSATAALGRGSRWWAGLSAVAAVLGAVSHPVTAPGAIVLIVLVLVMLRGPALRAFIVAVGAMSVALAGVAFWVFGLTAIRETFAFTEAYQSVRFSLPQRLGRWLHFYAGEMATPLVLAAVGLVLAALWPRLRRWRAWLVGAALALAFVGATQRGIVTSRLDLWSWLSVVLATILLGVLLVPAVVSVVSVARSRSGEDDSRLFPKAFVIGLVPTCVGVPLVAAYTSSAPPWGASGAALAPGLFVVVLAVLRWVSDGGRAGKAVIAALLVGSLATVHTATSFRDGPPGNLVVTVDHGAFAGLRTTASKKAEIAEATRALRVCAAPGTGVLAYLEPAAFLFGDVRFDTPIVWLDDFREANSYVVDWIERTGRVPECIVAPDADLSRALGRTTAAKGDPLLRWISTRYTPVASGGHIVVLRRIVTGAETTVSARP